MSPQYTHKLLRPSLAATLLLTTGCTCCGDACDVHSVEIVPPVVHAEPQSTFALTARARDENGHVIAKSFETQWSGGVQFQNSNANPTIATAPISTVSDVTATIGSATSPPAFVIVTTSAVGQFFDQVKLGHQSGNRPSIMLIDAQVKDDQFHNDVLYAVSGSARLPVNLTTGGSPEVAIFAPGRALHFETNIPWTDGVDLLDRSTLSGPHKVELAMWYRVADSDVSTEAEAEAQYASKIYGDNEAGMSFTTRTVSDSGIGVSYTGDEKCTTVGPDLGLEGAQPNQINVVYVAEIGWESDPSGWSCPRSATLGDVILISWSKKSNTTLAHELGHTMALTSPPFPFDMAGHTNGVAGFDEQNLLWAYADPAVQQRRRFLSLGQIFRMHVDAVSWLNASGLRTGEKKSTCGGDPADCTLCPLLALDLDNVQQLAGCQ